MFVPDRLKTNAYRVLALSANATLSEIHKAAATLRRAALLGLAGPTEATMPLLGETPRAEADIRIAIGRLENPVQRLSDRLFWFHLLPESQDAKALARPAEAIQGQADRVVSDHDEALHGLFAAFEATLDDAGVSLWVRALRAWHQVVSNNDYWILSLVLEEQGTFEPAVLPSEIDALRDDAVRLAAEGLVMAARDALARHDTLTVRLIVAALKELADTGPWAAIAQDDIVFPTVEGFRTLCSAVREEFGSKIAREQGASERNKSLCDAALKRFRDDIEPALDRVIQLVPPDHEAAQQSREAAALCLCGIATDYTWADDFITSETLHEEALRLAHDTVGAIRIEDGLEQVRQAAHQQRVSGAPISSAPSLSTINGFGCTLYGQSDYDSETRSYTTIHYFVALFIPIFPLGRYRVIDMGGGRYRFLGKLPLRNADRWHLGIAAMAIVAMLLLGVISSSQNAHSSSASSTNSYASSSRSSQLSNLKARIESGRSRIATLETQLHPVIDEIEGLNARMETLAAEITSLEKQHTAGRQINTDDYDVKVAAHNALLSRHRALIAAHSSDIQTYRDLVQQDSVLVKQYNALRR